MDPIASMLHYTKL